MTMHITDEIIDAILQNEGRHLDRPRKPHASARVPQAPRNMAVLKPDWMALPPNDPPIRKHRHDANVR